MVAGGYHGLANRYGTTMTTRFVATVLLLALAAGCQNAGTNKAADMDADAFIAEGSELLDAGEPAKAVERFKLATEADATNGQAFYCLGCALAEIGCHQEAVVAYTKSAELSPDHATLPLYNMGNSLQELKEYDRAIEAFRQVTKLDPTEADAWTNLGRLLDDQGKHAEAIECYDTALKHAPHDAVTLTNRGNSLQALGRYQEAIDSYDRAMATEPGDAFATAAKVACLRRMSE
jgi:tetratricopeptide (TPR) repeat protein